MREIALNQRLEQYLICILQLAQEDITMEIVGQCVEGASTALDLAFQCPYMWWEETVKAITIALVLRKSGALVGQRIVQERPCRAIPMECDDILLSLEAEADPAR